MYQARAYALAFFENWHRVLVCDRTYGRRAYRAASSAALFGSATATTFTASPNYQLVPHGLS